MSYRRIIEASKKPGKVARLLRYKFLGLFGNSEFRPFIVLTDARTGSNFLVSILDSHPNIRAEGELFRDLSPKLYGLALSTAFSKQPRHIKASGFKIFYSHARNGMGGGIWDHLERMEDLLVIHLKRRNLLRAFVSLKIAKSQGVWISDRADDGASANKAVTLTEKELRRYFEKMTLSAENGDRHFSAHAKMTIYYEDLVRDVEGTFERLTSFLGVPYYAPYSVLKRQNPERLDVLILNYQELKSRFSGTQWGQLFED